MCVKCVAEPARIWLWLTARRAGRRARPTCCGAPSDAMPRRGRYSSGSSRCGPSCARSPEPPLAEFPSRGIASGSSGRIAALIDAASGGRRAPTEARPGGDAHGRPPAARSTGGPSLARRRPTSRSSSATTICPSRACCEQRRRQAQGPYPDLAGGVASCIRPAAVPAHPDAGDPVCGDRSGLLRPGRRKVRSRASRNLAGMVGRRHGGQGGEVRPGAERFRQSVADGDPGARADSGLGIDQAR